MPQQPTLKDIARIANLHFTTVSMALRGHPLVAEETRLLVQKIAHRIGYRRNPAFLALSQRRKKQSEPFHTPCLAYLTNRSEKNGLFRTAHQRLFFEGAKRQALELGYAFELLSIDAGAHNEASLRDYLLQRGIQGLVLGAFEAGRPTLALLWEEYFVVKIDTLFMPPALHYVSGDPLHAVRTCFQHLQSQGCQRIGLAIGLQDEESSDDRHLSGLFLEQRQLPEASRIPPLLYPHGANRARALPLLKAWLERYSIDAVISNWRSIRNLLAALGYDCPGSLSCACTCLTRKGSSLAGIYLPLEKIGAQAVLRVAELIRTGTPGIPARPVHTLFTGVWVQGNSVRKKDE